MWIVASVLGCSVAMRSVAYHPSCCPELLCKRNASGILQCAPVMPKQSEEPFYEEYRFRFPSDGIVPEAIQECRK